MTWIKTVSYDESSGRLRALYDRLKAPNDPVDQILQSHSLRPHTLEGHMALYKNVLHHSGNRLPKWILETIGVYVSFLNGCSYCVEHHFVGLRKLLGDEARATELRGILERDDLAGIRCTARRRAGLRAAANAVAGGNRGD